MDSSLGYSSLHELTASIVWETSEIEVSEAVKRPIILFKRTF